MSAFDRVIGYENIKRELMQICDMIHNREDYEKLGASMPQGILLNGDPGLGKTLMANCFIEECGLKTYTIRRNKSSDDFVEVITETFREAKVNAPSIVFLDDMDKFANEDNDHRDAKEYVAIQAGIDDIKGCGVFVIATTNNKHKLPTSLIRAGRFDRKIHIKTPNDDDSVRIIEYYLSGKKVSDDINMEDLTKMFSYSSCAELESIINEAAIHAGSMRKNSIEMDDLVEAVIIDHYAMPSCDLITASEDEIYRTALHEAGHAVVCEILLPGSIGLISIRPSEVSVSGFTHRCLPLKRRPQEACVCLGGKAAVELYYADAVASGCMSDLERTINVIKDGIQESATCGLSGLGMFNHGNDDFESESYKSQTIGMIRAEAERWMLKTKDILIKNRVFLEKLTEELMEKKTLLYSDIQRVKRECEITEACL